MTVVDNTYLKLESKVMKKSQTSTRANAYSKHLLKRVDAMAFLDPSLEGSLKEVAEGGNPLMSFGFIIAIFINEAKINSSAHKSFHYFRC